MRCILGEVVAGVRYPFFRREWCVVVVVVVVVVVGESAAGWMSRVRAVSEVVSRCWSARESSRVGAWESTGSVVRGASLGGFVERPITWRGAFGFRLVLKSVDTMLATQVHSVMIVTIE